VREFLSQEASAHFDSLRKLLDLNDTPYTVVPTMVRGLDYYTRTIFEVQIPSEKLGAQAAVLGGGRYDNLIKQLGGRGAPAIGFSFGIERLLMILDDNAAMPKASLVFVAGVGEGGVKRSFEVARRLRKRGIKVEISYASTSLKSQLKRANRLGAAVAVIAGEDEAAREAITVRNMKNSVQKEVPLSELEKEIEAIL
jgi:histidyl-tRNA synthetase